VIEQLYATGGPNWAVAASDAPGAVLVLDDLLPAGDGYVVLGWGVEDRAGVPHRWFSVAPWDKEHDRMVLLAQHAESYEAVLGRGFPVTLDGIAETLQLRNDDDKINWLTFKDACQDMIDLGLGVATNPMPLRCTSNGQHFVTADAGKAMTQGLRTWAGAVMRRGWAIKDMIDAADSRDDFDAAAAAIGAGYPE
jgi:hypothetical protein